MPPALLLYLRALVVAAAVVLAVVVVVGLVNRVIGPGKGFQGASQRVQESWEGGSPSPHPPLPDAFLRRTLLLVL